MIEWIILAPWVLFNHVAVTALVLGIAAIPIAAILSEEPKAQKVVGAFSASCFLILFFLGVLLALHAIWS